MVLPRKAAPFLSAFLAEEVRALRKLGNDRRTASFVLLLNRVKAARSRKAKDNLQTKNERVAS
ncbi:MAG TPA: hypothetical protein VML56_08745 [Burkholderiales bacterium]|nr:hypothetical protein [Burkholderiales bacterium]